MVDDAAQLRRQREQLADAVKRVLRNKVALSPVTPQVPPPPARPFASGPLPTLTDDDLESEIRLLGDGQMPTVVGYELTGVIGQGGQGIVYRGTQAATGRDVAVKVLPGGHFADGRARSRFAREIRILARVAGPNVVPILDHGRTTDGSSFLVMPYIDGQPLGAFAASLRGNDRAIASLFARVADAIDAVHRAGVTHRDLKPDNVRVDRDATPHLGLRLRLRADWRAGPVADCSPAPGQVLGSLPWLSPEQAERKRHGGHRRRGPTCTRWA